MAAKRYQNDYRLDVRFEKSGKVSQSYTYIGRDWYFAASAETAGKMKKRLFLLVPAGWICFVAALVPVSAAMHTLPVVDEAGDHQTNGVTEPRRLHVDATCKVA